MWTATGKGIEVGLLKPIGAHIITPYALDARLGSIGFKVCPVGF
jgi:hypothetical protein